MKNESLNILIVHGSARRTGSTTRRLAGDLLAQLKATGVTAKVETRDLADGMPLIDGSWVDANFTPAEERDAKKTAALSHSDALVEELKRADLIVLASPIYNFAPPAAVKAWIDQISRARVTFQYTETGPVGLLKGKKAVIVTASGGTEIGSAIDFSTPYLKHALGFIGIDDVAVIAAERQMADGDAAASAAADAINRIIADIARDARAAA